MKYWKRTLGAMIVSALVTSTPASAQERQFITFAAGGSSGSWYVGSAVMSELIRKAYPELQVTPAPGGAVSNMRTVENGKAEIAFAIYQTLVEAYEGKGAYEKPHKKLRVMLSTTPFYQQIVVRKDSDIKGFGDLKGKRVTPSKKGFGGEIAFARLLEFYGLSYSDIENSGGEVLFRNYDDGAKMFMDGQVDLINTGSPAPHPPYEQIASLHDIRFLPIAPDIAKKYSEKYPGYVPGELAAGSYRGQDQAVPTIVGHYGVVTSTDVSDDVVYKMTKAIYEGRERIADSYGAYKAMLKEGAVVNGIPIPMHEGAKRYFKEIGLL